MFVPWLASSEVLGDRESDPERRDVRREPAFSKAFVCKVSGSLFAPTQALWLDRGPLAHGRRQFLCGRLRSQAVLRRQRSGQSGFAPWGQTLCRFEAFGPQARCSCSADAMH